MKVFTEHGVYVTIVDIAVAMGQMLASDLASKGQKVTCVGVTRLTGQHL